MSFQDIVLYQSQFIPLRVFLCTYAVQLLQSEKRLIVQIIVFP